MENALSLKDIAELTYEKVRAKGSFADWCSYLYNNRNDLWIICAEKRLCGMMIAKVTTPFNLYVMEIVTLWPGFFVEFTNRVNEFFGPIKTVEFQRRGTLKRYNFERIKTLANL